MYVREPNNVQDRSLLYAATGWRVPGIDRHGNLHIHIGDGADGHGQFAKRFGRRIDVQIDKTSRITRCTVGGDIHAQREREGEGGGREIVWACVCMCVCVYLMIQ